MRHNEVLTVKSEDELLEYPTEEEILCVWRSLKSSGISEDEAWHVIVTGIALDRAFARSKNLNSVVQ